MKYYHKNRNFMKFKLKDKFGEDMEEVDYLCAAHNRFAKIQKLFPYRQVNTNEENAMLSPRFVAEHCVSVFYNNVDNGNEKLADLVGCYGYTQSQFEQMQIVFNKAKLLEDQRVIGADISDSEDVIGYRVLKKDDPVGFVLGDITNCCQRFGRQAESCVVDGYLNYNAGFMVFEMPLRNEDGSISGKTKS
jgi:hypothetical protein